MPGHLIHYRGFRLWCPLSVAAPRASTEALILAIECRRDWIHNGGSFLDLGCGTGILAMYASRHFGCRATGSDVSQSAVSTARLNGFLNRSTIDVVKSDVWNSLSGLAVDVIVANFPLLAARVNDVRLYDPDFDRHRRLLMGAQDHLNADGTLLLVTSPTMQDPSAVLRMARESGLDVLDVWPVELSAPTTKHADKFHRFEILRLRRRVL